MSTNIKSIRIRMKNTILNKEEKEEMCTSSKISESFLEGRAVVASVGLPMPTIYPITHQRNPSLVKWGKRLK